MNSLVRFIALMATVLASQPVASQPLVPSPPANSNWVLDRIDGQIPGWRATINLEWANLEGANLDMPTKISGQAPCNRYFAKVETDGTAFAVKPIAATRMACADLDNEVAFFALLQGVTTIARTPDRLVLSGGGHEMIFVPG